MAFEIIINYESYAIFVPEMKRRCTKITNIYIQNGKLINRLNWNDEINWDT